MSSMQIDLADLGSSRKRYASFSLLLLQAAAFRVSLRTCTLKRLSSSSVVGLLEDCD